MSPYDTPRAVTRLTAEPAVSAATGLYHQAQELERDGRLAGALATYLEAAAVAERAGESQVLIDAYRRAGVVQYRRQERAEAQALCERSHDIAVSRGEAVLAGEALNSLGGLALLDGDFAAARETFARALAVAGGSGAAAPLRARIEQNLGILANIRGDLPGALEHYSRSLEAFRDAGDARWCALAYNNLGMVSADLGRWDDADRYYRQCLETARSLDDVYLRGLALMNHTEVFIARQQFEHARENAEAALAIFDQIGEKRHKSETYKILGMVYRETGRPALAEARLQSALALATEAGATLEEAEAWREFAVLHQQLGRNQDALRMLTTAHRLFKRLDARRDMVDVGAKVASLEGTYLAVVRQWGQSIESADSYTHGHCERVATYALAVARELGLDEDELTTIRLGAYLHDVGKVRVPHEILNKAGRLTAEELAVMQQHPVFGVELLAGIEFPWDIKPIIRWHHEKVNGSGYPDRLRGDEIPLHAQIICVVDVWDALTTTRSYRPALSPERALGIMHEERAAWRPDVFEAFVGAIGNSATLPNPAE